MNERWVKPPLSICQRLCYSVYTYNVYITGETREEVYELKSILNLF